MHTIFMGNSEQLRALTILWNRKRSELGRLSSTNLLRNIPTRRTNPAWLYAQGAAS